MQSQDTYIITKHFVKNPFYAIFEGKMMKKLHNADLDFQRCLRMTN